MNPPFTFIKFLNAKQTHNKPRNSKSLPHNKNASVHSERWVLRYGRSIVKICYSFVCFVQGRSQGGMPWRLLYAVSSLSSPSLATSIILSFSSSSSVSLSLSRSRSLSLSRSLSRSRSLPLSRKPLGRVVICGIWGDEWFLTAYPQQKHLRIRTSELLDQTEMNSLLTLMSMQCHFYRKRCCSKHVTVKLVYWLTVS